MKIKESYTLEELCSGLTIPLVKFCQMAGITEATLIRIRKGYSARQHTINAILAAFSKVYGIELDLSNVTGLTLQDKPHQTGKKTDVSTPAIDAIPQPEVAQIRNVEPKRTYKPRDTALPDGCILASKFAENHAVKRPTFYAHMTEGLGPGLIGYATDTIPQRDQVAYSERPKPNRPKEKERYLTQDQQKAALEFWDKYHVDYSVCDNPDCPCHTVKGE